MQTRRPHSVGYVLACSVVGKNGRCPSRHWCQHFPTGIKEVYRMGWKCLQYGHNKKRFVCDKHGKNMNMSKASVLESTEPFSHDGREWVVHTTPSPHIVVTALVGSLGSTSVRVVLNRKAFSPWGLQFRDSPEARWSDPFVLRLSTSQKIAISNPLTSLPPNQLLGWVLAAGMLEAEIVAARAMILAWEENTHGR